MGRFWKWWRTPKVTPFVYLISVGGIIYYLYFGVKVLPNLDEFLQVLIYVLLIIITALSGVTFVDGKKLARDIKRVMRNTKLEDYVKWQEISDIIDDVLYDFSKKLEKKKEKK